MTPHDLDDLFATARATSVEASPALIARVMQDALHHQPAAKSIVSAQAAAPKEGGWATLVRALGGGAALAGLGSATMAGLWIGFVQPAPLTAVSDAIWQETPLESVELIPSFDSFLTEG